MIGDGIAEAANEADLLGTPEEFDPQVLEMGTVGHEGAPSHYDIGTGTDDGNTLVAVTLARGRDRSKPITPGRAQGQQVWCQISDAVYRIPPPGTRVLVGFPSGMRQVNGAGVILATMSASPTIQFSATKAKLDYGPNTDLVIKARSITISDYNNRFISLGPDGDIIVQAADGTGMKIQSGVFGAFVGGGSLKSVLELTANSINLGINGGSLLTMQPAQATFFAPGNIFLTAAGVIAGPPAMSSKPIAVFPLAASAILFTTA
jgi:hypothetical protein